LTVIAACALALGLLWGAAVLPFASHTAAAEPPTVEFFNPGPSSACGSKPKVSSITLPVGTALVVVNNTDHDATLLVGGAAVLEVGDGGAAELTLAAGQHEVLLVPDCVANRPINALAVTITAPPDPETPSTGTSETTPPPGTSDGPASTEPPDAAAPPATAASSGSTPSTRPRAGESAGEPVLVPATSAAEPPPIATPRATPSAVVAGVISARPVVLSGEGHAKGLNLLAAIATICVLGVTVAIIRAIVRLSP
jgi:hypothetical protein